MSDVRWRMTNGRGRRTCGPADESLAVIGHPATDIPDLATLLAHSPLAAAPGAC